MTPKTSVTIIMGAYNGAAYIREQIRSIVGQSFVDWTLLVRDDGSTDSTASIVLDEAARDRRIVLLRDGDGNLGFGANFRRLLREADSRFIMYCDQDDVWLTEKVERMVAEMTRLEAANPGKPALVHSEASVVDSRLNIIQEHFIGARALAYGLEALLFQNCVQGASTMINAALRRRSLELQPSLAHDYHDALICALVGERSFITQPLMLYRQHENNVIGAGVSAVVSQLAAPQSSSLGTAAVPPSLLMSFEAAPHILRLIDHFGEGVEPREVRLKKSYVNVISGRHRLSRIKDVLMTPFKFSRRLDRFRLVKAIAKRQI